MFIAIYGLFDFFDTKFGLLVLFKKNHNYHLFSLLKFD